MTDFTKVGFYSGIIIILIGSILLATNLQTGRFAFMAEGFLASTILSFMTLFIGGLLIYISLRSK